MTAEWLEIIKSAQDQKKWRLIGFFYILIPLYATVKIRFYDAEILFWMFAIIWATDICAFFAGKALGGKKLAPDISPNKTWSGLGGGVIASALIGLVSSLMFSGSIVFFVLISILLSVIEQASDLLESKFKRIFNVKDSGNIIPGHGGVLDRLDGLMLVAPTVLLLITFFPNQFSS
jgi:phosphatidate cytidylyltransferase